MTSLVLFGLLAVVVGMITDFHDRSFPVSLGARSSVGLDFSRAGMSDQEAFRALGEKSALWNLGLLKIAPDLRGQDDAQVFAALVGEDVHPEPVRRFGDQPDSKILGPESLKHSYASGQYVVTGSTAQLEELRRWLDERQIVDRWVDDTTVGTLSILLRQSSFGTSVVAILALMIALVLYWLSVKARGRALRVLAGVPTWRIQLEDLIGFVGSAVVPAVVVAALAMAYVGTVHGLLFVPYYARTMVLLEFLIVTAVLAVMVALASASWPSTTMLARRAPAVVSLHRIALVLRVATLAMVLVAVAPAFAAFTDSRAAAAEQSRWRALSEEVALGVPAALDEAGVQRIMPQLGAVVKEAEVNADAALSYAWTSETLEGADLGEATYLALVDEHWLDLMSTVGDDRAALVPLPASALPAEAMNYLAPNLELWSRRELGAEAMRGEFSYYRYAPTSRIPLSLAGSGDLAFPRGDAIVMVVPSMYETFNDSFLASLVSSRNIVFDGLGPTVEVLKKHGLDTTLQVTFIAEEGVLRAQLAEYFALLHGLAVLALMVAAGLSAAIAAFISAVLRARHDFPLGLAGKSWPSIVGARVAREWAAAIVIGGLVAAVGGRDGAPIVLAVTAIVALFAPLAHLVAARWAFTNVGLRRS